MSFQQQQLQQQQAELQEDVEHELDQLNQIDPFDSLRKCYYNNQQYQKQQQQQQQLQDQPMTTATMTASSSNMTQRNVLGDSEKRLQRTVGKQMRASANAVLDCRLPPLPSGQNSDDNNININSINNISSINNIINYNSNPNPNMITNSSFTRRNKLTRSTSKARSMVYPPPPPPHVAINTVELKISTASVGGQAFGGPQKRTRKRADTDPTASGDANIFIQYSQQQQQQRRKRQQYDDPTPQFIERTRKMIEMINRPKKSLFAFPVERDEQQSQRQQIPPPRFTVTYANRHEMNL